MSKHSKRKAVTILLMLKRFRRRIKSKKKRARRNEIKFLFLRQNCRHREIGKNVHSLADAIRAFMPPHFCYLINQPESPFYQKRLKVHARKNSEILKVPRVFSILDNPKESYRFLQDVVSIILYQTCRDLCFDYANCQYCDLPTQTLFDSILIDNDRFITLCQRANVDRYLNIHSVSGYHINDEKLQLMINSVGSPVELINRKVRFKNVIPFKLRHIDTENTTTQRKYDQKEIDATDLIQYVIDCLGRFHKTLTQQAKQELGCILGETISNAEEHSSLHNRYLIGYMEECSDRDAETSHYGLLKLVIMNSGKTIYECFKYPDTKKPFNQNCLNMMKSLSDSFTKKNLFHPTAFTEENLWTLYTLQSGVSIVPKEMRNRGNGTIEFIDSFFKIKGSSDVDQVSRMSIISGHTEIDFDGTYPIYRSKDNEGKIISRVTFNTSKTLEELPDKKYVYHIDSYFPGTLIYAQLLIQDNDLTYEKQNHQQ